MKRSILFLVLFAFLVKAEAQSYRNATGIRFDSDQMLGITVQQKVYDKWTVEGLLLTNVKTGAVMISALAEQHNKILFKNLNIYFGAGIHKTWDENETEIDYKSPSGIAGIGGIELTLDRFNVSWDFLPKLNIWGGDRLLESSTGVSVRYVMWKKKKKKFNWKFWKKRK